MARYKALFKQFRHAETGHRFAIISVMRLSPGIQQYLAAGSRCLQFPDVLNPAHWKRMRQVLVHFVRGRPDDIHQPGHAMEVHGLVATQGESPVAQFP